MAWLEVQTDVGAKAGLTKYSVAFKHGGARVSVPPAMVDKLGWSDKSTFKLLVGAGDLEGKLRIEPVDGGKITARRPPPGRKKKGEHGGLIVRLGRWKGLAERDVKPVACEAELDKSALIITLPRHALNVAPEPRPVTAAAPGPTATTVSGKVSVNDKFFNDPKRPPSMASGTRGGR